jgi:hypothetical protein
VDRTGPGVWEQLESGRVVHRFEPIVLSATLALIPVFVIEAEAASSRWSEVAYAANWLIWLAFAAELTFILVSGFLAEKSSRAAGEPTAFSGISFAESRAMH